MLTAQNTATPTFTQSYQRQQPALAPAPPPIAHTMATIPHQPAYRAPTDRIFYMSHACQPACLNRVRPAKPDMHRGKNPLLTPLLYDFRRMTGRRKVNRKVNLEEVYINQKRWTHEALLSKFLAFVYPHCSQTQLSDAFCMPSPSDVLPRNLQGSMWALPA